MAELTAQQRRALALAQARRRQRQQASVTHPEFDPANVPGGTGEPQFGMLGSFLHGAADTGSLGFGDEIASTVAAGLGMLPGGHGRPRAEILDEMRGRQSAAQEQNPGTFLTGQVGGGIALGAAAGPATASARFAGSALAPRMLAGAADGLAFGGAYGAGSGETAGERLWNAARDGAVGAVAGVAFPVVASGVSRGYQALRDIFRARPIANQAGTSPEALRALGGILDADDALGASGRANMARAGQEGMLVDAGPTARDVLDTAIQRSGPGARVASNAVRERVGRDAQRLTQVLDDTLGAPQGVTAARTGIRNSTAGARSNAYDDAYRMPIDYADPRGQAIERIVKTRVPQSAIRAANRLMRAEGVRSRQILANVADDGTVTFERLPDVRQLDYITRGLNEVAEAANAKGKLGGVTDIGRAYGNISREIRDTLKELVPEYGRALETAADPIRRSQAVKLGSNLATMARDEFSEAAQGMTRPERQAVLQGFRSRLDDQMARVTRAMSDGDMDAREAIQGLRELSSRQARENIGAVMDASEARRLFDEVDRITQSFDLRASVAQNSRTYGRQATDQRVDDMTAPGAVRTAARGEPIGATKRVIQALTGETDEALRGRKDAVYGELARLLTQRGGAGQNVYDAINQIGQTDQATALMRERIVRALAGPHLSYPLASQSDRALR